MLDIKLVVRSIYGKIFIFSDEILFIFIRKPAKLITRLGVAEPIS